MTFYADSSILRKIPGDLIARGGRHCRRQEASVTSSAAAAYALWS